MLGMLALGGMVMAALLVFAVFGVVIALIKGVLLLILLPFRLAGGLIGLLVLPILVVMGILAVVAAVVGGIVVLVLPLLPLAAVAFIVWLIAKATTRPAALVR